MKSRLIILIFQRITENSSGNWCQRHEVYVYLVFTRTVDTYDSKLVKRKKQQTP
jgi:hypothetical protein